MCATTARETRGVSKALPLPPALPPPPPQPAGTVHADRVSEAEMRKEWHYCDPSVRVPGLKRFLLYVSMEECAVA